MRIKTTLGLSILFFVSLVFLKTLYAADVITNRTGTIKITRPDGIVLTVNKHEPLPVIPSGSTMEVLSGGIDIAPTEGFIQVVVGNSVATVKAGDSVTASFEPKTKMASFKSNSGQISVITGNTTAMIKVSQEALFNLDKRTGVVEVRSVKGTIETITVGIKTSVSQGAIAMISADPNTRNIRVKSVEGNVIVTSIDGGVIMLAKAESTDIEGSAEGEIQTFAEEMAVPFVPAEEPVEPERPEASPHIP